jgi:hypothetical protein
VYGNVGVAQPVSVYFQTSQTISVQQPLSVYGQTSLGLEVYGNVGVFQPVSVYFATPQKVVAAQPVQVYGNVGVAQPVSVYFQTSQTISIPEPVSVYFSTPPIVQIPQPLSVYHPSTTPVFLSQPAQVYGTAGALPVSVYDTQVINDATQVFAGQIPINFGANFQMVPAQAGQSFSATLIDIWNIYGAAETVALRFGATGTLRFIKKLNPNTGFVVNLVNSTWRGPTNTALFVYNWEVMGGPLSPSGGFVTYTVMGQYLP